jgi:glycosyltransferase involved in cell wall biosynthesis
MNVLVPMPFDLTNLAHGRNLRIVHLLRELAVQDRVACIVPDQDRLEAARRALPVVDVQLAEAHQDKTEWFPDRLGGSGTLARAIGFVGFDAGLAGGVIQKAIDADVVLAFDAPSVSYLLAVRAALAGQCPRLVADMIDDPWLTWQSARPGYRWSVAGLKAAVSVRAIRREALPRLDAVTAVAPRDADSLAAEAGYPVFVCPNGVQSVPGTTDAGDRDRLVVFTGAMDFPPNESAAIYLARRVWPRVLHRLETGVAGRAAWCDATWPRLALVGANPTPRVGRLAGAPHVEVTGRVEDMNDWLGRARVAAAPMVSGCGIKNKVLEAAAAGCTVVATPLGAEGLPTGRDVGICVTEGAEAMARQIVTLLVDDDVASEIGCAARTMVRTRFSWATSAARLRLVLMADSLVDQDASFDPSEGEDHTEAMAAEAVVPKPEHKEAAIHASS